MNYLGIDPGGDGALAIITNDTNAPQPILPMPMMAYDNVFIPKTSRSKRKKKFEVDVAAIKSFLDGYEIKAAAIELIHAMPGNGAVSMFTFGENFSAVKACIRTLGIPLYQVKPKDWQKHILGFTTSDKKVAQDYCQKFFPNTSLLKNSRCRTPHSGIADAICVGVWLRDNYSIL